VVGVASRPMAPTPIRTSPRPAAVVTPARPPARPVIIGEVLVWHPHPVAAFAVGIVLGAGVALAAVLLLR